MENIFQFIGKAFLTLSVFVAGIFGIGTNIEAPVENVGASIPVSVAVFQTSLQTSISATATEMTLVSGTDKAGNTLSGYMCFNLDEGTAKEEFVCGTVAGTAVTSMIRGIDPIDGDLEVTALKKTHNRGGSVKITNYPSLGIVSRILNGNETIPNAISYASGVGPTASSDLADKEYVLSVVSGGSVSFEKVVVSGTAGETIASGNLVYLKSSDSRWWKTDADTASTVENVILGIAQGSGTAGVAITGGVLTSGIATNLTGLTANTVYYASNTAGGLSSTVGTKEVTVGTALSTTSLAFAPRYNQQITEDEQDAISGGSTFGTPSNTNKFITQDYNSSATGLPVVRTYSTVSSEIGGSTTQFDITNPSGTTFRYTWDSTGTDPSISLANHPVGSLVNIQAQNFTSGNNGVFVITGAGTNYFEVTNASGVVESNKTIGTGYIVKSGTTTWSKPSGLKYITVELVGGGGGGGNGNDNGANGGGGGGGGAGGYSKESIAASSLSSSEYFIVGATKRITAFGNYLYATGGSDGDSSASGASGAGGIPGVGVNGTINNHGSSGAPGSATNVASGEYGQGGNGGSSFFGGGAAGAKGSGVSGSSTTTYGAGGGGGAGNGASASNGGTGYQGVIILTEYYS